VDAPLHRVPGKAGAGIAGRSTAVELMWKCITPPT
jgi:hypothetical protein